jgi:response regulator RpfG family c-di-GMP phosphodiesterase
MHHRPTVLLVHDDIDARVRFGNWLAAGGYRCLTSADSASALRFAGRTSPDVAVIDIGRRDRDRLWLAERLRDRATPIGVVLMSEAASIAHAAAAIRLGLPNVLVRPRDPAELLDAVGRAATWRDHQEAKALDAREALLATVAARHAEFRRVTSSASTATVVFDAVCATFRDEEPALLGHARRVAIIAGAIARALHLSSSAVVDIHDGALLHDLGKLALPEDVLLGRKPVGDSEMEALLDHHNRTLDLLRGRASFAGAVRLLESAFEGWDGLGYPSGLSGTAIPFGARIIAVADAFDAAVAACRSSEPRARYHAGRAELEREAGARLDPDLVRVYLHLLGGEPCS